MGRLHAGSVTTRPWRQRIGTNSFVARSSDAESQKCETWWAGVAMAAMTCGTRWAVVGFSCTTRTTQAEATGCFHGILCLRRWLEPGDRVLQGPHGADFQLWLRSENLARSDGDHRLRFPAHGAHFGRRGGA